MMYFGRIPTFIYIRSYYEKQAKEKLKELRQVAKNKYVSGEYESDLDYNEEVDYYLVLQKRCFFISHISLLIIYLSEKLI